MKRLLPFLLCFFLFSIFNIHAQEEAGASPGDKMSAGEMSAEGSSPDQMFVDGTTVDETPSDIPSLDQGSGDSDTSTVKTEEDYIEMDIRTSTLMELATWCRELGLSEGGAREELAARLRSYYQLPPAAAAPPIQRVITIESAKTTEYFTLEVVNEEYARLKGDVIISLKDGDAVHRIKAWEILFNRTRNIITATGKVEYVKEEGDTVETFKGDSITVNLDNWSSIFMDGVSERSKAGNVTAYRFAGTVISRNSEEVTVLTGADITNPMNDEAFWSLHASKLWLLPGNDWAILNAVLKVGNIPLLYLPFFYYPSDEIVFHPVLGYRSREGTFLQTTTYILGRPKTEAVSENSITKIFGSASENMEKKREGVFLRTTGEKTQDPNDTRLSVLFDVYVNMGAYLGTELALPRKGIFGETNLSAGVGLTRNIYQVGNANTPFLNYDGTSEWNRGMLFSMDVPFRYRFNVTGSMAIKNGSFSWAVPYYSDPYVDRDFLDRSEVLDWLSMLRESAGASSDITQVNDTSLTSYEWRLSGSYNPPVSSLAPYINSFSISSISSSLLFNTRNSTRYASFATPPNPENAFFFPSRFTMYSISALMSGTPFTSGTSTGAQARTGIGQSGNEPAPGDALLPDLPLSPWETDKTEEAAAKASQNTDVFTSSPPVLSQRFDLPRAGGSQFSVDYRLTPTSASEMQFNSNTSPLSGRGWNEQKDVNWDISSILSRVKTDGNIGLNMTQSGGGAYSGSLRFYGTGAWQDYAYLNKDAEDFVFTSGPDIGKTDPDKVKAAQNNASKETYFTSSWDLSTTVSPFYQSAVWGKSNLQYNLRGLLAKNTADSNGDRSWAFAEWDKDNIDNNQVTANLAASIMDYNQTISVSAMLPPKDSWVSGTATFRAWITQTSARGRVLNPMDDDLRKFDPVYLTETLTFGTLGNFQQYVVFDPERNDLTTVTSSLNLSGFTASYSMVYAKPWKYNPLFTSGGSLWWQDPNDVEQLIPREFRLGYVNTFPVKNFWNDRLSFSVNVNSSLSFDLQRYTNSNLAFSIGFNVGIANFLDLYFSTSSENVVVYKYFQNFNLPFFSVPVTLYPGQEYNFFTDLYNSFQFWNTEKRKESGFKLKSLSVSLIHHLGDWNAKLTVQMTPYRDPTSLSYRFSNEISFLIQWVPIGEIKTQIDYKDETLSVK